MPRGICAIANCKSVYSKTRGTGVSYHRFPKNKCLRKIWLEKCKKCIPNCDSSTICSEHFQEEDFIRDFRNELLGLPIKRQLKPGVVPSRNLPFSKNVKANDSKRTKRYTKRLRKKLIEDILKTPTNEMVSNVITETKRSIKYRKSKICKTKETPKFKLPLLTENKFSFTGQSGQAFELDSNSSLAHKDSSASNDLNVRNKLSKPTSNDSMNGSPSYKVKIEEDSSTIPSDSVDLDSVDSVDRSEELLSSMTCERFPDSQSQILGIKIKQEPEDPVDIPSTNSQNKLTNCGQESQIMSSTESSLFQPPVLIKEEIVSEEEEL